MRTATTSRTGRGIREFGYRLLPTSEFAKCPTSGQVLQVYRAPESYGYTPIGVRVRVQCRLVPGAATDAPVYTGCGY